VAPVSALAIRQGTPEWLEARREYVTSTDLPIILGLSPYKVEADLATEKLGQEPPPDDLDTARRKRLGKALERVVRDEDRIKHGIPLRAVHRFIVSRQIDWAATSLDFERVGERTIVEAKTSRSPRRFDGELPQDVEAQVRWQMGVAGYPRAHVAVLKSGSELECFDVEHDPATFDGLVDIAADFRDRLAKGGPFTESLNSLKRRYPGDNGAEMVADPETEAAVAGLVAVRERRKQLEADEEHLEEAIKARMGEYAVLSGAGFHVTWKRTKDVASTDWKSVADGLLRTLPEPERIALVGIATTVRPGFRPFRVVIDKENQ
jgi:putative phage-type endonuclease